MKGVCIMKGVCLSFNERHTQRQTHHIAMNLILGDLLLSFHVPHTHLHRSVLVN